PPDSTYAWFIVVAAFLNLATTMGTLNSFGVYQEYYLNDLYKNDSAGVIAWISTLNIFCTFFGSVVTGKLTDEFGFRITCLAGAIICGVALILASFTHTVWQLMLTQDIMLGLGTSLVFSPSMSVVAQWNVKHRILATGIAVSGGGVGGMIISNATRRMIDGIGYCWSLRVLGLLVTAISGSASLVYKRRMSAPKTGNSALLFNLFRDPRFLCINAALMFLDFAFYEPMLYMPTAAVNETGLKTTASNIVLVFNAGTAAGRVLSGPIADLLGPHNTNLAANSLICVLIFVFMQGVKTIAGYYAFISLYGILCTLYLAINVHILADEFGTQAIATAVGLNTACSGVGSLVGNPVLGALYENY
ncbi:MFS general substrate transporter, partial [Linderina pennispora]